MRSEPRATRQRTRVFPRQKVVLSPFVRPTSVFSGTNSPAAGV